VLSVITTKFCPICKERRSLEYFWIREDNPNRFYAWCVVCCGAEHRDYDYPLISTQGGGSLKAGLKQLENMILT